jgi:hypothetical protein
MTLRDFLVSVIRTAVPALVGLVLAHFGLKALSIGNIPVELVVETLVVAGYYSLVRFLEARWRWVGVLLGWAVVPSYTPAVQKGD